MGTRSIHDGLGSIRQPLTVQGVEQGHSRCGAAMRRTKAWLETCNADEVAMYIGVQARALVGIHNPILYARIKHIHLPSFRLGHHGLAVRLLHVIVIAVTGLGLQKTYGRQPMMRLRYTHMKAQSSTVGECFSQR